MINERTISLDQFCINRLKRAEISFKKDNKGNEVLPKYFIVNNNINPHYVEPYLKDLLFEDGEKESNASKNKIIMISAPGATGKTMMRDYLSAKYEVPVFDLANFEPVGKDSFVGMLYNSLEISSMASFLTGLKNGNASVIIDALDEGFTKTGIDSFYSFLNDIAEIAKSSHSSGLPFIIMGRPSILELAATYFLIEKNVKTSLLRIKPFTLQQANDFIDKQIGAPRINKQSFKDLKLKYLNSIKDFFESSSDNSTYNSFIGYAPVLLTISKLFMEEENDHAQLQNETNMCFMSTILDFIIEREKGKVTERRLLDTILKNATNTEKIYELAYNKKEQCHRLLCLVLNKKIDLNIFSENILSKNEYEKKVQTWLDIHPFLDSDNTDGSKRFHNIVFESYVLEQLIDNEDSLELVLEYLGRHSCSSFMFFQLFATNKLEQEIDCRLIPYLLESFQSLDTIENKGKMRIIGEMMDDKTDCVSLNIEFIRHRDDGQDSTFEFHSKIFKNAELTFNSLSNVVIDAPITISLCGSNLFCPIEIMCDKFIVRKNDISITKNNDKNINDINENSILIQCEDGFEVNTERTPYINKHNDTTLTIITNSKVYFPFINYVEAIPDAIKKDSNIKIKYQKLRKIIFHYFHNSAINGSTASQTVIDRFSNSYITGQIINYLKKRKIINEKGGRYFLEKKNIKFDLDDLYNFRLSSEIQDTLSEIES